MCEYHVKLRTHQVPCKWLFAWPLECAADLIFESAFKGLSTRIMFRTQFSLFDHTCHPRTQKHSNPECPRKDQQLDRKATTVAFFVAVTLINFHESFMLCEQ